MLDSQSVHETVTGLDATFNPESEKHPNEWVSMNLVINGQERTPQCVFLFFCFFVFGTSACVCDCAEITVADGIFPLLGCMHCCAVIVAFVFLIPTSISIWKWCSLRYRQASFTHIVTRPNGLAWVGTFWGIWLTVNGRRQWWKADSIRFGLVWFGLVWFVVGVVLCGRVYSVPTLSFNLGPATMTPLGLVRLCFGCT